METEGCASALVRDGARRMAIWIKTSQLGGSICGSVHDRLTYDQSVHRYKSPLDLELRVTCPVHRRPPSHRFFIIPVSISPSLHPPNVAPSPRRGRATLSVLLGDEPLRDQSSTLPQEVVSWTPQSASFRLHMYPKKQHLTPPPKLPPANKEQNPRRTEFGPLFVSHSISLPHHIQAPLISPNHRPMLAMPRRQAL